LPDFTFAKVSKYIYCTNKNILKYDAMRENNEGKAIEIN
jgi:5'(3')-deoxyribonucleotidase